jgi:hypothetical protein
MRVNVQPVNALRGSVTTRGDATTSQGKQEGGGMRGKVIKSRCVERQWWQQGDKTTILEKREGGA